MKHLPPRPNLRLLAETLFTLWIFALPWQTRWIVEAGKLNGDPSEFQTLVLYGTQLLLLLCWWVTAELTHQERRLAAPERRAAPLLLALLVVAFVSVYWSVDARLSLFRFVSLALAASVVFLLPLLRPRWELIALALFVAAVIQSGLAVIQFEQGLIPANSWLGLSAHSASTLGDAVVETSSGRFLRAYGSFSHPNLLGGFLAIAAFSSLLLWSKAIHRWERTAILFGSGIIGMGLVLTFSRGTWVAVILTSLVLLWTKLRTSTDLQHLKPLTPIATVCAVAALLGIALAPLTLSRLQGQGRIERLSIASRSQQFSDAWTLAQTSFLQGTGLGAMTSALQKTQPERSGYTLQPVHVVPLLVVIEIGIVGGLIFLALLARMLVHAYHGLEKTSTDPSVLMASSIFFVTFFLLWSDHFLWTLWSGQTLFWLVMGLLANATLTKKPPVLYS